MPDPPSSRQLITLNDPKTEMELIFKIILQTEINTWNKLPSNIVNANSLN